MQNVASCHPPMNIRELSCNMIGLHHTTWYRQYMQSTDCLCHWTSVD